MNNKLVGLFNWNDSGNLELVQLYENHIVADKHKISDARKDCKSRYPNQPIKSIAFDRDNHATPPGFVVCAFSVGRGFSHEQIYVCQNLIVKTD